MKNIRFMPISEAIDLMGRIGQVCLLEKEHEELFGHTCDSNSLRKKLKYKDCQESREVIDFLSETYKLFRNASKKYGEDFFSEHLKKISLIYKTYTYQELG